MTILDTDIKVYESDISGNIDTESEIVYNSVLFPEVLDGDNDLEKKIFIYNDNVSEPLNNVRAYIINGYTLDNTVNTPIVDIKLLSNITAGIYTLTFPTTSSVVVTKDSVSLDAQEFNADESLYRIFLNEGQYLFLAFDSDISTSDQATITISNASEFITLAEDISGIPDDYAEVYTFADGIELGNIEAGSSVPLWVKQSVPDLTNTDTYKVCIVPRCR